MANIKRMTKQQLIEMHESLAAEHEVLVNTSGKLEKELARLKENHAAAVAEKEEISAVAAEKATDCETLNAMHRDLVLDHRKQSEELARFKAAHDGMVAENKALRRKAETLTTEIEALRAENQTLLASAARMTAEQEDVARALARQNDLVGIFLNDNPEAVLLVNAGYDICFANPAAADLLGLDGPEACLRHKIFDFFKYKDALELKHKMETAFRRKKGKLKDVKMMDRRGKTRKVSICMEYAALNGGPALKMTAA